MMPNRVESCSAMMRNGNLRCASSELKATEVVFDFKYRGRCAERLRTSIGQRADNETDEESKQEKRKCTPFSPLPPGLDRLYNPQEATVESFSTRPSATAMTPTAVSSRAGPRVHPRPSATAITPTAVSSRARPRVHPRRPTSKECSGQRDQIPPPWSVLSKTHKAIPKSHKPGKPAHRDLNLNNRQHRHEGLDKDSIDDISDRPPGLPPAPVFPKHGPTRARGRNKARHLHQAPHQPERRTGRIQATGSAA